MKKLLPTVVAVALSTAISSQAGAVAVTEPPDLQAGIDANDPTPASILLDFGLNTVTGTISGTCSIGYCPALDDQEDTLQFSLPDGSVLTSAYVDILSISGPSDFRSRFIIGAWDDENNPSIAFADLAMSMSGTYGTTFSPGLAPTNFYTSSIRAGEAASGSAGSGSYSVSYRMKLGVGSTSVVPLPPTALLLGSGLLLGGVVVRRRKTAAPSTPV